MQEGQRINRKRVQRIWHQEALTVTTRVARKVRTGATIPMKAEGPNHVALPLKHDGRNGAEQFEG
ncbi:hypothetical protein [Deinococcus sp. ME38]|uniref:hypothetical protein n=1 Tax=Deinococcus sp. ME38 TaxID=3400344 RepID=UPI003B5A1862